MRVLLDTHVYLWWLADSPKLTDPAATVIGSSRTLVCVSAASVWEASMKASLGRLDLDGVDLVDEIPANGFAALDVTAAHGWAAGQLPRHYRDPFDRVLVAQARMEQLVLITHDDDIARYDVPILGR